MRHLTHLHLRVSVLGPEARIGPANNAPCRLGCFRCPPMQIPLDIAIRVRSDSGLPIVVAEPGSPCAQAYVQLAHNVQAALREAGQGAGPVITAK